MTSIQQCPLCIESFNSTNRAPKLLLCGHSFCVTCLLLCEPVCPYCRRPFNGGNAVRQLTTVFRLIGEAGFDETVASHQVLVTEETSIGSASAEESSREESPGVTPVREETTTSSSRVPTAVPFYDYAADIVVEDRWAGKYMKWKCGSHRNPGPVQYCSGSAPSLTVFKDIRFFTEPNHEDARRRVGSAGAPTLVYVIRNSADILLSVSTDQPIYIRVRLSVTDKVKTYYLRLDCNLQEALRHAQPAAGEVEEVQMLLRNRNFKTLSLYGPVRQVLEGATPYMGKHLKVTRH